MIFISSSCSRQKDIASSITEIAEHGFLNIELSGGTIYYQGFERDVINLKEKYNLNFLLHNYFPPPKNKFVLNLASLNEGIFIRSFEHCKNAILLSKRLDCKKYSIHAGFLTDIDINRIGKKLYPSKLFDKNKTIKRFCDAFNKLKEFAGDDFELYLENNVISSSNYIAFNNTNPFMLTDYNWYLKLVKLLEFKLLLDLAHLKVSCNTLGYNYDKHLKKMIINTDYIHISDNDGLHDQNKGVNSESNLFRILKKYDISDKIITLEVYESYDNIKNSFETIKQIIND